MWPDFENFLTVWPNCIVVGNYLRVCIVFWKLWTYFGSQLCLWVIFSLPKLPNSDRIIWSLWLWCDELTVKVRAGKCLFKLNRQSSKDWIIKFCSLRCNFLAKSSQETFLYRIVSWALESISCQNFKVFTAIINIIPWKRSFQYFNHFVSFKFALERITKTVPFPYTFFFI